MRCTGHFYPPVSPLTALACYLTDCRVNQGTELTLRWLQQHLQLHLGSPMMLPKCCNIILSPTTQLNIPKDVPDPLCPQLSHHEPLALVPLSYLWYPMVPLPAAGLCPTDAQGTTFPPTIPRRGSRRGSSISITSGDSRADNDICCRSLTLNPASQNGGCSAGKGSGCAPTPSARGQERGGEREKAEAAARQLPLPPPPFVQKRGFVCQSSRLFSPSLQANCFCSCKIRD